MNKSRIDFLLLYWDTAGAANNHGGDLRLAMGGVNFVEGLAGHKICQMVR